MAQGRANARITGEVLGVYARDAPAANRASGADILIGLGRQAPSLLRSVLDPSWAPFCWQDVLADTLPPRSAPVCFCLLLANFGSQVWLAFVLD